jgi:3-phosphoshikimate 1-carboxyvinyltransferase
MSFTESLVLARTRPAARVAGVVRVPGDKSVSQRLAMLAGLAHGTSRLHGYLQSEDCLNTLQAMCRMGARAERDAGGVTVTGTGGSLRDPGGPLDLGNSGTGIRLLTGLVAGLPLDVTLTGDAYLQKRPMRRVQAPLVAMGAQVDLTGEKGCPPIRVRGGKLRGIRYPLPMASAQVKSCVLLAGLHATGDTTVVEPSPTRDYTETLLRALGVDLRVDGLSVTVRGYGAAGPDLAGRDWQVPGDFSSAAFWIVAAAVRPGVEIVIEQVGLNPRRTALLDVLQRMGADIAIQRLDQPGEPIGQVRVRGAALRATELRAEEAPILIDEVPILATAAAFAEGVSVLRHAEELRVKESDRIATMVANLRRLGVEVEEFPDGLAVRGPARLRPTEPLKSYGDHRIAMSMAVAALHAETPFIIEDTGCILTSYPTFWEDYRALGGGAEVGPAER